MRYGVHVCKVALILASALIVARPISAHDVWITVDQDPTGNLRAIVHHGHPGDRKTPDPDKLFELNMLADGQPTRSLLPGIKSESQGNIPVLITEPVVIESGLILLAAGYDNGYWVKTQNGYRNTNKRQVPNAEDSLYSMKFAKTLIQAGIKVSEAYRTIVGHRLELVPLSNPFVSKPGDNLKVQVIFDGKPLPGGEIEYGDGITPMKERDIPRYKTDNQGVAVIPITRRGPHLFVVDHMESSIHPDLAGRELYNSTLSFVLP